MPAIRRRFPGDPAPTGGRPLSRRQRPAAVAERRGRVGAENARLGGEESELLERELDVAVAGVALDANDFRAVVAYRDEMSWL